MAKKNWVYTLMNKGRLLQKRYPPILQQSRRNLELCLNSLKQPLSSLACAQPLQCDAGQRRKAIIFVT